MKPYETGYETGYAGQSDPNTTAKQPYIDADVQHGSSILSDLYRRRIELHQQQTQLDEKLNIVDTLIRAFTN